MTEKSGAAESSTNESSSKSTPGEKRSTPGYETYGYDLYPDRKGYSPTFADHFFTLRSRGPIEQYRCEKKVVKVAKTSPLVRIMVSALEKAGCPFNFRRHVQCEFCEPLVTGGYDPMQNQVVICHNTCRSEGMIQWVLVHELIHMFDNCTREMDFKNIDHVACSEIRAANLTYCRYLSAFYGKTIDRSKIKGQQQACVRKRASDSVYAVREVTREEADAAVDRVFTKCYYDMEPIGRRCRNTSAADLAYSEAFLLGYD